MKTRVISPFLGVGLLLLGACGDAGNGEVKGGAVAPQAGPEAPKVQLPSASEIEAEAAVAPEDAEDAFEQLKRDIEADSLRGWEKIGAAQTKSLSGAVWPIA